MDLKSRAALSSVSTRHKMSTLSGNVRATRNKEGPEFKLSRNIGSSDMDYVRKGSDKHGSNGVVLDSEPSTKVPSHGSVEKLDKSKKGLGYNVVPPPHPLIYNGPKKLDLSYSGLDEFKDPEFKTGLAD
ncbi:hypothetical protein Tco_0971706 [Tanacetum coccineum]